MTPSAVGADLPPQPPTEPEPGTCCGSGCQRCVYDVYDDAVARYERAMAAWRIRNQPAHILDK